MVSNEDVVRTLERVAALLEIKGENVYKVRAYRSAATQVENLGETLRELPGVGPRTAASLWHEAGITTLDQLEAAAINGGLAGLPRLGARTVERILGALEDRRQRGGKRRRPRADVEPLAANLVDTLYRLPEADLVEAAGSYRRGREALGDLDIVVATSQPAAVLAAFAALPQVERVLLRGDTKCSVEIAGGFQVDCRAVSPQQFGAAMQYFTGSQAHNVRLRGRALRMGLTLNEYGVFRIDDGTRIAGDSEETVYAALGLRWIEPEQREDRGEVEAATVSPAAHEV